MLGRGFERFVPAVPIDQNVLVLWVTPSHEQRRLKSGLFDHLYTTLLKNVPKDDRGFPERSGDVARAAIESDEKIRCPNEGDHLAKGRCRPERIDVRFAVELRNADS